MRPDPILLPAQRRRERMRDLLVALLLGAFLSLCWTVHEWGTLKWLNLPDNDDMMRLAQVRDWIAGQGFNDWTQYRLGPPEGAPMHWSRLNDLAPAAIILLARPLLGGWGAEMSAILLYPALLFVAYLYLSARIARVLAGARAALPAIVIAAVAYPANSLFLPGRIDHHALQIVLTLATILALMLKPLPRSGIAAGACVALSLIVGLEGAPAAVAVMVALFALWVRDGAVERARVAGFGLALAGITAATLAVARPTFWSPLWCDAFTPASAAAALIAGGYWAALGLVTPRLADWRLRLGIGAIAGLALAAAIVAAYPVCLSGPYGPMDPFVRHAFMDNVVEAGGLFQHRNGGWALPVIGMMLVASVIGVVTAMRGRASRRWWPMLAVLVLTDLVLLVQVRGAYLGSAIVAPILATMVLAARRRATWRLPAVLGAWALSAGMLWLVMPVAIDQHFTPSMVARGSVLKSCKAGDSWAQLDRVAPGTVMAPIDMGAHVIAGSHHRVVAAGYHRNNAGNRAMYDFFLAGPARARTIGRVWKVDYVVICPTDFAEVEARTAYPDSLATALLDRRPPAWLRQIPLRDTGLAFYRVVP